MNKATAAIEPAEALQQLGTLYRDADGIEVWSIRNLDGTVHADGIGSDFDAEWIAGRIANQAV